MPVFYVEVECKVSHPGGTDTRYVSALVATPEPDEAGEIATGSPGSQLHLERALKLRPSERLESYEVTHIDQAPERALLTIRPNPRRRKGTR